MVLTLLTAVLLRPSNSSIVSTLTFLKFPPISLTFTKGVEFHVETIMPLDSASIFNPKLRFDKLSLINTSLLLHGLTKFQSKGFRFTRLFFLSNRITFAILGGGLLNSLTGYKGWQALRPSSKTDIFRTFEQKHDTSPIKVPVIPRGKLLNITESLELYLSSSFVLILSCCTLDCSRITDFVSSLFSTINSWNNSLTSLNSLNPELFSLFLQSFLFDT